MKRTLMSLVAVALVVACFASDANAVDNPQQVIVSSSGDNTLLAAISGKRVRVHALAVIATSTDSVSFYIKNGDNDLLGDSSNTLTVDLDGIDGPQGFILPENRYGWFATDTANEALQINLSDASRPVIVLVVFSVF